MSKIKKEAELNVGENLVEVEIETGTGENPVTRWRYSVIEVEGVCVERVVSDWDKLAEVCVRKTDGINCSLFMNRVCKAGLDGCVPSVKRENSETFL